MKCAECSDWGEWYDNWGMCPCFACFPQDHVVYQVRRFMANRRPGPPYDPAYEQNKRR